VAQRQRESARVRALSRRQAAGETILEGASAIAESAFAAPPVPTRVRPEAQVLADAQPGFDLILMAKIKDPATALAPILLEFDAVPVDFPAAGNNPASARSSWSCRRRSDPGSPGPGPLRVPGAKAVENHATGALEVDL
jgi:hypothetical protein